MKKFLLTALLVPAIAFAQTYPSPTFNSVTLQNPLTASNGGTGATTSTGTGAVVLSNSPTLIAPALGVATATTQAAGTSNNTIATTNYVTTQVASGTGPGAFTNLSASGTVFGAGFTSLLAPYAPIASPTFTGTATIPMASIAAGAINGTSVGATTPSTGAFTTLSSTAAPTIGPTKIYPTVANNAALQGLSTAAVATVTRLGFYASGDAPPLTYTATSSPCTINAPFGDNGAQVDGSNGNCWVANFPTNGVDVSQYGAKGDGTTDDSTAIQTALNDSPSLVLLSAHGYRVSTGITVPQGKGLHGVAPGNYDIATDSAPAIIGDLSIATIVTVTGGGTTEGVALANVLVTRAAGTIPTNSIGVAITNSANSITARDVLSMRSYIGFSVGAGTSTSLGVHLVRCYTGTIPGYHIQISNVVEVTVTDSRFGRNGGVDVSGLGYVNINGATVDTVRFTTTQFNVSGGTAVAVVAFTGYASNANGIVSFMHCHMEQWLNLISADSGTSAIRSLRFVGNTIDSGSSSLFYNGAANKLTELMLVGNRFDGGFTVTLDQQLLSVIEGNHFGGTVLINAGTQVVTGNYFDAAVTLQGSSARTVFVGNAVAGGLTNTMTGTTAIANNI